MLRIIVVIAATFGFYAFLSTVGAHWIPAIGTIAFVIADNGITWLMLSCLAGGYAAYKVTK